jgi:hypothetical protein
MRAGVRMCLPLSLFLSLSLSLSLSRARALARSLARSPCLCVGGGEASSTDVRVAYYWIDSLSPSMGPAAATTLVTVSRVCGVTLMGPAAAITLVTAVTVSYAHDVPWRGSMKSVG